jgi:hypothetical protein
MFAGQDEVVGTVTFSAPSGGTITITIELTGGWTFAPGSVVAVQDYDEAPSGNPAPGSFDHKEPASGTTATIVVPVNALTTGSTPSFSSDERSAGARI